VTDTKNIIFCVSCLRRPIQKIKSVFCVGCLRWPTPKIKDYFFVTVVIISWNHKKIIGVTINHFCTSVCYKACDREGGGDEDLVTLG
jgi:hypothetical protein